MVSEVIEEGISENTLCRLVRRLVANDWRLECSSYAFESFMPWNLDSMEDILEIKSPYGGSLALERYLGMRWEGAHVCIIPC